MQIRVIMRKHLASAPLCTVAVTVGVVRLPYFTATTRESVRVGGKRLGGKLSERKRDEPVQKSLPHAYSGSAGTRCVFVGTW